MLPIDQGPVSETEEALTFTGSAEAAAKADAGGQPRKSKFEFDEGFYPVEVTSIKPYTSSAGNPMFLVTLIGIGNDAARGIDYRRYLPLTGNGVGITQRTLKVFGVAPTGTTADGEPVYSFKPSQVIGKRASAKLVKEEYNGKTRMKVDAVFALRGNEVLDAPKASSNEVPF